MIDFPSISTPSPGTNSHFTALTFEVANESSLESLDSYRKCVMRNYNLCQRSLVAALLALTLGTGIVRGAVSTVNIVNFSFDPATLTIQVGDTVNWVNQDSTPHTSTSGASPAADGLWGSGSLALLDSFSHQFTGTGTFPYFCVPHASFMQGSVTVQGPAGLVWVGGTGDWDNAANWSPAQVPTASDPVFITNSGTYTVTVPAGTTASAASLTLGGGASGKQTLALDRATLNLEGPSTIKAQGELDFLVSQSVLSGNGNLNVDGTVNWANGSFGGSGVLNVGVGGTLAIGSAGVTLGRNLNNSGTCTWSGGNFNLTAGHIINNSAGGTFDITADGRLSGAASTPINNTGLFRLSAGSAGTVINAPLNNNATVQVIASTLNLNLGGTDSGIFTTSPGAVLNLGGGSHVLSPGAVVSPGSLLSVGGGATLDASATFGSGSTLSLIAGSATLTGNCDVSTATLLINGANCVLNYNITGPVATMVLSQGILGGLSPVNVTGLLTLNGGNITNSLVTALGGLSITGNTTLTGARLINPGVALWTSGRITGANGSVISNLTGATFINTFDGNIATGAGALPLFINAGLFQKTNGTAVAGNTSIDFEFVNTGTVEVRTNTLRYAINEQQSGLTLLNGGKVSAQAAPLQILGGSLVGAGALSVANNQNVVNDALVDPGSPVGKLDISGNYQQTARGTLRIELGGYAAGSEFDLVSITGGGAGGVASLGGTLLVNLANGFSPTNGASFTFLVADSRVGAFAAFDYPSNELGMQLVYDATSVKVVVSNLKPLVTNPLSDPPAIAYGNSFDLQFPANTFTDPNGDALTYSVVGLPPGLVLDAATRRFSGNPTQTGVFAVSLTATDNGTPSLSTTNRFTITVAPAPLSVTAQPKNKPYGTVDPALTYTVSGLQLTDTPEAVLTGALSRLSGESVSGGPYPISQGSLSANSNYTLNFTGSALVIDPALLTVIAEPKAKLYGAADPPLTFSVGGLQFTDTQAGVLTGSLARIAGESVVGGPYAITQGNLVANSNYTINFAGNTLSVTPAPLTIAAEPKSKIYGAADPSLTFTVNGLQFSDTQAAVLSGSLARVAGETVSGGPYAITQGNLLANNNYTLSYAGSTFTITPAPLSIRADSKSKAVGAADPAFTVTYSGFVSGDIETVLGGSLSLVREPGEAVGTYQITPSGLTSSNYGITFLAGILTIEAVSLPLLQSPLVTANQILLTWTSLSNKTYRVQYSTALNASVWLDLPGDVLAVGSTSSKTDIRTATNRFYRVVVVP